MVYTAFLYANVALLEGFPSSPSLAGNTADIDAEQSPCTVEHYSLITTFLLEVIHHLMLELLSRDCPGKKAEPVGGKKGQFISW
jgi:hypothetical protein